MNRVDVVELVVDLFDVDLDVGLVDVDLDVDLVDGDLDVDLVDVDLVVFLSSSCFLFFGLLAPGCILGFWPPPVLKFLSLGCMKMFGLWLFWQYFCPAVFRAFLYRTDCKNNN